MAHPARAAAAASEVGAVRQQLEELQARQREHAVLTEQLAEQAQALAQGLELLSVRLKVAFAWRLGVGGGVGVGVGVG